MNRISRPCSSKCPNLLRFGTEIQSGCRDAHLKVEHPRYQFDQIQKRANILECEYCARCSFFCDITVQEIGHERKRFLEFAPPGSSGWQSGVRLSVSQASVHRQDRLISFTLNPDRIGLTGASSRLYLLSPQICFAVPRRPFNQGMGFGSVWGLARCLFAQVDDAASSECCLRRESNEIID
jgi:hypothetical protein